MHGISSFFNSQVFNSLCEMKQVPEESTYILKKAKEMNANVMGLSFHVGRFIFFLFQNFWESGSYFLVGALLHRPLLKLWNSRRAFSKLQRVCSLFDHSFFTFFFTIAIFIDLGLNLTLLDIGGFFFSPLSAFPQQGKV